MVDLAKQPFYALRDAISKVVKSVKVVVKKIKQTLIAIKRIVLSIREYNKFVRIICIIILLEKTFISLSLSPFS